jgi:CheY-like chemotaxis protein/anti-sigma regulatory factor (Ser/Thr protein kinase)
VLDYSRLESGTLELQYDSFDLYALVNERIQSFRLIAESKNLELISHIHHEVPSMVTGDAPRLRQIITHLLSNALKFTENGEVIVSVRCSGANILFTIQDTGIGMSKKQLDRLMNQKSLGHTDEMNYHGFGFAVVKQLIARMNGKLDINSDLGRGTQILFEIKLPAQSRPDSEAMANSLSGRRILVVDDNDSCLKVIRYQASAWGMHVSTAHNGNEALASLRSKANLNENFDVVIIDQGMPGMTGMQLATRIQGDRQLNPDNSQLVMLTGLSNAPDLQLAHEAGISRILSKPVTGKTLKIVLMEEINKLDQKTTNNTPEGIDKQSPTINPDITVLVAEDNSISMKLIQAMLGKLGVKIQGVDNGQRAVEAIKTGDYAIIFMDCEMPVVDGFEATRQIRSWEAETGRTPIPIIALTAHVMDEHKEQSHLAGMNAHLTKPVHIQDLAGAITQWVGAEPN